MNLPPLTINCVDYCSVQVVADVIPPDVIEEFISEQSPS